MKRRPIRFILKNDTWRFEVAVMVGGTAEDGAKWARGLIGDGCQPGSGDARCWYADEGGGNAAIWFDGKPGADIVAHEALHAICHLMQSRGMEPMNPQNDEAYCYLLQWLVSGIGNKLW